MIITYLKILDLPVVDMLDQELLGHVFDVVIDPVTLSITAIGTKSGFFWNQHHNAVSTADIIELAAEGVVVNSPEAILPLSELPKIEKLWKNHFHGVGQRVYTEKGVYLGRVFDIFFENKTFAISKIDVRKTISERIIGKNSIVRFEAKKIIVSDEFESVIVKSPVIDGVIA